MNGSLFSVGKMNANGWVYDPYPSTNFKNKQ